MIDRKKGQVGHWSGWERVAVRSEGGGDDLSRLFGLDLDCEEGAVFLHIYDRCTGW